MKKNSYSEYNSGYKRGVVRRGEEGWWERWGGRERMWKNTNDCNYNGKYSDKNRYSNRNRGKERTLKSHHRIMKWYDSQGWEWLQKGNGNWV